MKTTHLHFKLDEIPENKYLFSFTNKKHSVYLHKGGVHIAPPRINSCQERGSIQGSLILPLFIIDVSEHSAHVYVFNHITSVLSPLFTFIWGRKWGQKLSTTQVTGQIKWLASDISIK